ncbi:ATP-binding protein [Geobacter sulfurreducens subsp. ethanolicus]|uniref:sensor histidine kinase n=1 Tax=Geobacter sulfurreducens TaxID=35554 RepID=UPI0025736C93|nr:ATP-binding protein [Geobacter sulfurreducens]BEH09346.1 ATP-binding protein [Geobacter sulfurreducens subsp. ethanolicus]
MTSTIVFDVISAIGFAIATGAILRTDPNVLGRLPKLFLTICMSLYTLVGLSNIIEHAGITPYLDRYEDYLEIIFIPFFLFFVFSVQNEEESRRRIQAEQETRAINENLELLIAERTAALEASNRELESFCYSVSHDLRAPLRHIDGYSRILLEDLQGRLNEEDRLYLERLRHSTLKMESLINDLLELSRVTRSDLDRQKVDLSLMAREIVAELGKASPARAVEWHIDGGMWAQGDPLLLRVALVNLLGNAWKYTNRTAHAIVEFSSVRENNHQTFFVRDNGAGFSMDYADKLFIPFQRLHREDEFEGTGVGLATVKRIIARHGGRIWAESAVDHGATFYFTLR